MFDRFRQQYPHGSILSNLVQIHGDQYIVSVSVAHESVVLVTTLAADANLEAAEARAVQQAMTILGFQPSQSLITSELAQTPAPTVHQPPAQPQLEPVEQSIPPATQSVTEPEPQKILAQPMVEKLPAQVQENAPTNGYQSDPPATDEPSLSVTDMIPLINMELKRLNWSREKGRDCIIALYNKRSSSLLSDEELLGLLRHLQAQTVPD